MRYHCFKENRTGIFTKGVLLFALLFVLVLSGCTEVTEPEPQLITVNFPEGAIKLYFLKKKIRNLFTILLSTN